MIERLRQRLKPEPPTLEFVLVLTLGRTGSTLVQGVLNSFPGYLIRGENDNYCHHLYRAERGIARRQAQFAEESDELTTPRHPWYGLGQIDRTGMLERYRSLVVDEVLRPHPDTTHVGFKEIRYAPGSVPDLDDYLGFLADLFPGVKAVVNTRDPVAVAASSFWRKRKGDVVSHVRHAQDRLVKSVERSSISHVVISYEDYTASVAAFRPVCELLGQPWQPSQLEQVLAQRHSI